MLDVKRPVDYKKVIDDDGSLQLFLATLAEFDHAFCDCMTAGDDYTISVEVHGAAGKLVHCRMKRDGFKRPKGAKPGEDEWRKTREYRRYD